MSRMMATLAAILAIAVTASAQTAKSKSAASAKGQAYDVEFVFDDQVYSGTMTLQIPKKGGKVGGVMTIDRPTAVNGEVVGTLQGDALALDYPYTMVEQNCTGRVVVTAKMTPRRDSAIGTATASGCGDSPVEGTFSLKKPVKPVTD